MPLDHLSIDSSCSIGFSLFPDDSEDFDTLVNKADKEMYKYKNNSFDN